MIQVTSEHGYTGVSLFLALLRVLALISTAPILSGARYSQAGKNWGWE